MLIFRARVTLVFIIFIILIKICTSSTHTHTPSVFRAINSRESRVLASKQFTQGAKRKDEDEEEEEGGWGAMTTKRLLATREGSEAFLLISL